MTKPSSLNKEHFQSNMLDGDAVQGGQMIASWAVLEYINEYYTLNTAIATAVKSIINTTCAWNGMPDELDAFNNLRQEQYAKLSEWLGDSTVSNKETIE